MPKITVLIPVLNEEKNLPGCLDSVTWADEILVIDSFSTDRTLEIARSYNTRIVQHAYENHAAQLNRGIRLAAHEWVLLVDADERVTPELREEIQGLLKQDPPLRAYRISFRTFYFGKEIRYGGFGNDWHIRFFHRDAGYIKEGVHGDMVLDFKPGKLRGTLLHYTSNTVEEYFDRFHRYTGDGAKFLKEKNKKVNFTHIFLRPVWRFISKYFLRCGFRDGLLGLNICMLSAFYVFTKYFKLWYLYQMEKQNSDTVNPE